MQYLIEEITVLIGAHRYGNKDARINWILTDSRSLVFPETSLFFALKSSRNDGHRYIPNLYQRGVRSFVVSSLPSNYESLYHDANFLLVVSPLTALQRLAERHREEFSIPIVGITGSNGKTVVKEWLYQLLSPTLFVTRSPRSYNSQVGVPLSVLLLGKNTQVGIFEAGISQPGEMEALRDIIQPTIGLITNLGSAHQENFDSLEQKCREKLVLFRHVKLIIYQSDNATIRQCVAQFYSDKKRLDWSLKDPTASLYIYDVEKEADKTSFSYRYKGEDCGRLSIPFIDDASLQNAVNALAVCLSLGISREQIKQRMAVLEPVAMRLEVKEGVRSLTIINDSYNSDINSLDIALDFMNRRPDKQARKHILILSDIEQTGVPASQLYARVAELTAQRGVNRLIGVGPEISSMSGLFNMPASFFNSTKELFASNLLDTLSNDVVLIKGARQFEFETISEHLSLRVHETTLEVNLSALVDNLNHYRGFLRSPKTKIICMVKASGYGTGAIEVAKTLQEHGVDYLAVAVADEGAELRRAGIERNIMIMNPEISAFQTMFHYHLEPEVYSFRLLDALINAAEKEGITNFPIHIKLDTGMHRMGFNPLSDIDKLIDRLHSQQSVIPRSVFSHFVGSDSPEFDDFTRRQFRLFNEASLKIQAAFPHKLLRHICNSAGIERFPDYQLDMVRLGLGLYGIDPITNNTLRTVSSLYTTILQIHSVGAGESVGYSRRQTVSRPSKIASIPIGYADGLNRHLGCGHAYCLVCGQKAQYVGNICMDVCMIDVTDIPEAREGDRVEIFGENLPVTRLSDTLATIPYEVLTGISTRVKRVYFQD